MDQTKSQRRLFTTAQRWWDVMASILEEWRHVVHLYFGSLIYNLCSDLIVTIISLAALRTKWPRLFSSSVPFSEFFISLDSADVHTLHRPNSVPRHWIKVKRYKHSNLSFNFRIRDQSQTSNPTNDRGKFYLWGSQRRLHQHFRSAVWGKF